MKEDDILPGRDEIKQESTDILVKVKGEFVTLTIIEALELAGVLTASVQVKLGR